MERETGFEPATFSLARRCSTPEPLPHFCGAGRFRPATILYSIPAARVKRPDPFYSPSTKTSLSWRPPQRTSTDQVEMKVKDALARVRTHIPEEPIAAVGYAFAESDLGCHFHQSGEQRAVVGLLYVNAGDMAARHHQDMDWGGRIPISKSYHGVVCVDESAGKGSAHYATESAVWIEIWRHWRLTAPFPNAPCAETRWALCQNGHEEMPGRRE
jgi:hypothetical protein